MTSWCSRFRKPRSSAPRTTCARSCSRWRSSTCRSWPRSASARTGTRRTERLLQGAEDFPDDARAGADWILADPLLLLGHHQIKAVQRLLGHVLIEIGVFLAQESDGRGALRV